MTGVNPHYDNRGCVLLQKQPSVTDMTMQMTFSTTDIILLWVWLPSSRPLQKHMPTININKLFTNCKYEEIQHVPHALT